MPAFSTVRTPEQSRVFHPSINRLRIVERRLEVPHSFELPGMLLPVIKLMSCQRLSGFRRGVIHEFITLAFRPAALVSSRFSRRGARLVPGVATIIGTLNNLSEPATGL